MLGVAGFMQMWLCRLVLKPGDPMALTSPSWRLVVVYSLSPSSQQPILGHVPSTHLGTEGELETLPGPPSLGKN